MIRAEIEKRHCINAGVRLFTFQIKSLCHIWSHLDPRTGKGGSDLSPLKLTVLLSFPATVSSSWDLVFLVLLKLKQNSNDSSLLVPLLSLSCPSLVHSFDTSSGAW